MCRGGERVGEREGEGEGKDAVMATTYIHTCTHLGGNIRCVCMHTHMHTHLTGGDTDVDTSSACAHTLHV